MLDVLVWYADGKTDLLEITRQDQIETKRFKAAAAEQWCSEHGAQFVFLVGDGYRTEAKDTESIIPAQLTKAGMAN